MNAEAIAGDDTRMSRETPTRDAFRYAANPRPISRATVSLISLGYRPRMSYALKIAGLMVMVSGLQSLVSVYGLRSTVYGRRDLAPRNFTKDRRPKTADDQARVKSVSVVLSPSTAPPFTDTLRPTWHWRPTMAF